MSDIIKIDLENYSLDSVIEATEAARSGKPLIFPTETVYGIGVPYDNAYGIENIYRLKKRSKNKPLQILIAEARQAEHFFGEPGPVLSRLMENFWPGPLTIIDRAVSDFKKDNLVSNGCIGLRCPDNNFLRDVIRALGKPLASTSANISEENDPHSVDDIDEGLKEASFIIDGGKVPVGISSTVVNISTDPPLILRQGPINPKELTKCWS